MIPAAEKAGVKPVPPGYPKTDNYGQVENTKDELISVKEPANHLPPFRFKGRPLMVNTLLWELLGAAQTVGKTVTKTQVYAEGVSRCGYAPDARPVPEGYEIRHQPRVKW